MRTDHVHNTRSRERAGVLTMTTITIKILETNGHSAASKLADAEPGALLETASSDAKE
jgi:hypothetical protein